MTARNKFGAHVVVDGSHGDYGAELERCAAAGQPFGLVKSFFDKGALGQAKSVSRNTFTVYRASIDDMDFPPTDQGSWFWESSAACKKSALDWMSACAKLWEGERENFDACELVNEPNPTDEKIDWFIEWSHYCLDEAERLSYHLAWGSFSAGCPTEAQMERMLPFVAELTQRGHVLAMHDGAVVDPFTFAGTATDINSDKANSSLRYRWWKMLADKAGLPFPRVVITECYAYGHKVIPAFYNDWRWYLEQLARDDDLLGVAWYTLGNGGDFGNIAGDPMQRVVSEALAINYGAIEPSPTPETIKPVILQVKYRNQNGEGAGLSLNDCGPACMSMVANYLTGDKRPIDEWTIATGAGTGLVSIAQMVNATSVMGYHLNVLRDQNLVSLRAVLDSGKPCILLVNPIGLQRCGTVAPHFILAVGYSRVNPGTFYCHDPYFLNGGKGGPLIEQTTLDIAWSHCHEQGNPDWLMMTMEKADIVIPPIPSTTWRGLQLRNGDNAPADWNCVRAGKLDAVKFTTDTAIDDLYYACTLVPPSHILLRLFMPGDDPALQNPVIFASMFGIWLDTFASVDGVYVEVHNEPNLDIEGLGAIWFDGAYFSNWLIAVLAELRKRQSKLKYGFPGLSPGGYVENVRMDEMKFYNAAKPAVAQCDWLGVHCYWLSPDGMNMEADGAHYKVYRNEGKPLIITEFSNPDSNVSKADKGRQYKAYYASLPSYIIGAYSFISSADNPTFASETWAGSDIPGIVGA